MCMLDEPKLDDTVQLVVAGDPKQRKQRLLEMVGRSGLTKQEQGKIFKEIFVKHHKKPAICCLGWTFRLQQKLPYYCSL